jgi:hypothetical protein
MAAVRGQSFTVICVPAGAVVWAVGKENAAVRVYAHEGQCEDISSPEE